MSCSIIALEVGHISYYHFCRFYLRILSIELSDLTPAPARSPDLPAAGSELLPAPDLSPDLPHPGLEAAAAPRPEPDLPASGLEPVAAPAPAPDLPPPGPGAVAAPGSAPAKHHDSRPPTSDRVQVVIFQASPSPPVPDPAPPVKEEAFQACSKSSPPARSSKAQLTLRSYPLEAFGRTIPALSHSRAAHTRSLLLALRGIQAMNPATSRFNVDQTVNAES